MLLTSKNTYEECLTAWEQAKAIILAIQEKLAVPNMPDGYYDMSFEKIKEVAEGLGFDTDEKALANLGVNRFVTGLQVVIAGQKESKDVIPALRDIKSFIYAVDEEQTESVRNNADIPHKVFSRLAKNEQHLLFQALSNAGELENVTEFAKREKIRLFPSQMKMNLAQWQKDQTPPAKKEAVTVDETLESLREKLKDILAKFALMGEAIAANNEKGIPLVYGKGPHKDGPDLTHAFVLTSMKIVIQGAKENADITKEATFLLAEFLPKNRILDKLHKKDMGDALKRIPNKLRIDFFEALLQLDTFEILEDVLATKGHFASQDFKLLFAKWINKPFPQALKKYSLAQKSDADAFEKTGKLDKQLNEDAFLAGIDVIVAGDRKYLNLTKKFIESFIKILQDSYSESNLKNYPYIQEWVAEALAKVPEKKFEKLKELLAEAIGLDATKEAFTEFAKNLPHTAEPEAQVEPDPYHDIRVVEIENLVEEGKIEYPDAPLFSQRGGAVDSAPEEIITQPRLLNLIALFEGEGYSRADMVHYKDKVFEGQEKKPFPYSILEIKKGNHHFQIAVCDAVGHATFILRQPKVFDGINQLNISALKLDDTVFKIDYHSAEQWQRQVAKFALTPQNELDIQLKTKTYWAKKKDDVLNTVEAIYKETGRMPKASDGSIVAYGPLVDATTPRRMAQAISRGSIIGLDQYKRLSELCDFVEGHSKLIPIIEFDANDVFRRAVLHIRDTKELPPEDPEFRRSLKALKVKGLADIVGEDAELITSTEDFLVAAGVAEKKDQELVPASPATINMMARLLGDTTPKP